MAIASSSLIDPFAEIDHRHASGVSVVASRDELWDARSYLITAGSDAVLIDGNGNLAPLVAHARTTGSVIHAVLLTHTHEDHVAGVAELSAQGMPVLAHPDAPGGFHGTNIAPGDVIRFGSSRSRRSTCRDTTRPSSRTARAGLVGDGRLDLPAHRRRPRGAERSCSVRRAHDGHSGSHPRASARDRHPARARPCDDRRRRARRGPVHAALQRRRCASGAARLPRRRPGSGLWEAELLLIAPTTTAASRHSSGSPRSDARWCPAASSTPPRGSPGGDGRD